MKNRLTRAGLSVITAAFGLIVGLTISPTVAGSAQASGGQLAHPSINASCSGYLPSGSVAGMAATPDGGGYWITSYLGQVVACGDAPNLGSISVAITKPIVGMAATASGNGYWLVASDGGVFSFGDAVFHGSTGAMHLNKPIVGMAVDQTGNGYWLVASDGGIFSFGDAVFQGSTGAIRLNKPVVGMATDSTTGGYWLVASDGGIFAFNAPFDGSMGATPLTRPVVGMASTSDGGGYWLVAGDGGIFSFGDALFQGSTGAIQLNKPIVQMAPDVPTGGYWFVASDGGIFSFGAPFLGSAVAPAPVAPTPPVGPPGASCTVSMSPQNPAQYTDVVANIVSSVPNATVQVTTHYRTITSYHPGTTDSTGNASVSINVYDATVGYVVGVTVSVGSATCYSSFTPS